MPYSPSRRVASNIRFVGSYGLLKWILKKYKQTLPYNGEILKFAKATLYSKDICYSWNYNGVQIRAWNCLHKDLMIAHLAGKIDELKSLEELEQEYEELNRND